jgi:hypothetical protein
MRFSRIERDDHALVLEIDFYIVHAFNFHERPTELSDSAMMILAYRGDFDGFQDGVIGALWEKGIGWIGIAWSRGVHRFCFLFNKRVRTAVRSSRATWRCR